MNITKLQVVVGAHTIKGEKDPSHRRFYIKRAVVHEGYSQSSYSHDVMLLQLSSRIKFNKKVRPICVDDSVFPPGTACMTTGWGSTHPKGK